MEKIIKSLCLKQSVPYVVILIAAVIVLLCSCKAKERMKIVQDAHAEEKENTCTIKLEDQKWEIVKVEGGDLIRIKTCGGWLVKSKNKYSVLTFVPDEGHYW